MTWAPHPQPGLPNSRLPVAASGDAALNAYQRSPTLMAGESASVQGQVRVWIPSDELAQIAAHRLQGWAAYFVCLVLFPILRFARSDVPVALFFTLLYLTITAIFLRDSRRIRRRLLYMTTDEAGIAITTRKGSVALRWSQLTCLVDVHASNGRIMRLSVAGQPTHTDVSLATYPRAQQEELIALITAKARLVPAPNGTYRRARCRSTGPALPPG